MLTIATCQFAVSRAIARNGRTIRRFVEEASAAGADLAHFPEAALSGYAGVDLPGFSGFDWDLLVGQTREIMALAAQKRIWVVFGSAHRLATTDKPHNCLYVIGPDGRIRDRYDKRFCMSRDLEHYTPGDHFVTFKVRNVTCACLICFDLRFPELYRELYRLGTQVVIQSFYNARQTGPSVHSQIMRQTMQAHAATHAFWVSMANASAPYAPYPSCFIRPDGTMARHLRLNRCGMMLNRVDPREAFYDPMKGFRELVLAGRLDNRPAEFEDPRSKDRTVL